MRLLSAKLFTLWLTLLMFSMPVHSSQGVQQDQELKVAVLAFRGSEKALQRWDATMRYLSDRLPGYRLKALPMNLAQLDQAVQDNSIDFAITNSGQYVRVDSKHGMSWIATLKSKRHPGLKAVIGSTLVVKKDAPYQTLADLENSSLGAVDPLAFGGFQIYWGEMVEQGYLPERFFSDIKFSGFPVGVLAFWVRDGITDAAVLPVCTLENMISEGLIDPEAIRVIDAKQVADFNCQTSTKLYPNWAFSALKSTPVEITEAIARLLLQIPADSDAAQDAGSLGWTAPVSSHDIHNLYDQLDIHPWQQPWWQEMYKWLLLNWKWSLIIIALLLAGLLHHIWIQIIVQQRTREIQQVHEALRHQQLELEHAQRVAILGELSSDIAHELNQPLSAINNYAEGGVLRYCDDKENTPLNQLFTLISNEAQRGAQIIKRIRRFALKQDIPTQQHDLVQLIRETTELLGYETRKHQTTVNLDLPDTPLAARVDAIEIQQILVNLIRNSLEAMEEQEKPEITIRLEKNKYGIVLQISDNGCGLEQAPADLFKPFSSSKPDGMGLGMSICKRIIEAHRGTISIAPNNPEGTTVTCEIPGTSYE